MVFQSTPPRKRRHPLFNPRKDSYQFQSTPPRKRRRSNPPEREVRRLVSIHASAQEATCGPCAMPGGYFVSIHASAQEATDALVGFGLLFVVSIHASAQEATRTHGLHACADVFQSTPPRKRRRVRGNHARCLSEFQSTPPRKRRPPAPMSPALTYGFNPRLRARGDTTLSYTSRNR